MTNDPKADPRRLKPAQLIRTLNSTSLGEVIDDRRLRRMRDRAGLRIGDGKTIDLLKFVGWLASERHLAIDGESNRTGSEKFGQIRTSSDSSSTGQTSLLNDGRDEAYERKKERERERNAAASRSGRDIAPIPVAVNPERRAAAETSLLAFAESYFPDRFELAWSPDHLQLIAAIEESIVNGGLHAFAFPRGSGKTSICEVAVIWAAMTGRRKYVALIGSSKDKADELIASIKAELEGNDLLAEDWPEVCYPIAKLEGINNRARGQLCNGLRTQIRWAGSTIVLPTVDGSEASGAIICVRGLTGQIRGMKFTRSDGKSVRPDLAVIDDPQTDDSARSIAQVMKRKKIVTGAILGLAGPGKKIAAAMPCTVIEQNDLADQLLDRSKHPEWNGVRCKLVYEWPPGDEAKKLWDQYADVRRRLSKEKATELYAQNREVMDAGSRVGWEARKEPGDLSALQHAFNLKIERYDTFDAEYQNEPRRSDLDALAIVPTAEVLASRLSRVRGGVVPLRCDKLTAFIDVHQDILFHVVAAWSDDFTGSVIKYGTEPDQQRHYFNTRGLTTTLRQKNEGTDIDGAILAGLTALMKQLTAATFRREDGIDLRIQRVLIDAGYKSHLVYQVCRQEEFSRIAMPSFGRSIGPAQKPISSYEKRAGDRIGLNWMITKSAKRAAQHLFFDSNWWKGFLFDRFAVAPGDKGSLTLFGADPHAHYMLSEHLTAEYPIQIESKQHGRTVTTWENRPGRDNHWFDGVVGCAVAASLEGCALPSAIGDLPQRTGKKRISYKDYLTMRGKRR